MRYCKILFALFLAISSYGQIKDKRAELDIQGRINEVSVSPDEKIWFVTAIGKTYFTDKIDSNWHYGKPLSGVSNDEYTYNNPNLERISFFNKDTAIITGYISFSDKEYKKNGYYLTKDGGKSWNLLDYGGNSWVYTIHTNKSGNAWMGGLSNELYYSDNFGQSWTTIRLPYKSSDRTYGIFMTDSKSGIASSDHNEILKTEDNWKTVTYVKTPLDQKKFQADESRGYVDDRISKILKWNNYIVVNQYGNIFYSEAENIDWKPFPISIVDFELDLETNNLYAITDSLKAIYFTSPTNFKTLCPEQLSGYPIDIKVVNKSLYILCNGYEVSKASEKGLTRSIPYTTDQKISKPYIVKQYSKMTWGINGNQIYLSEVNQEDWYRENTLEFSVADFMLLNDSTAILWDGVKNNYLYSLHDHSVKNYSPVNPLKNFVAFPVKSLKINSGSSGCFHSLKNEVIYERADDSTLTTSKLFVNNYDESKPSSFKNKLNSNLLSSILSFINSNPSAIPSLSEFKITEKDKKNYLELVDKKLKNKETDLFNRKKKINKEFYYSVLSKLDTLNSSIITNVLDQQEGLSSTTRNWFTIQIINQNNDTLNISRNYYVSTIAWNLPWKFEYNGLNFNCYNIEFSRFINTGIPDKFMDKDVFDNRLLIIQIADYLYNK